MVSTQAPKSSINLPHSILRPSHSLSLHQSLSAENDTSERRSAADLQRILDSLIGDAGYVLAGDLPDGTSNARLGAFDMRLILVLAAYEKEHDLVILDPSEYEGLRALCGAHGDMELGPSELFQFLSSAMLRLRLFRADQVA